MKNLHKSLDEINAELRAEKAKVSNEVTKAVTNAVDTSVSGLRVAILAASPAITIFNNVNLPGDSTEVPVLNIPNGTATDFTIDGIEVTRTNISTLSDIADETIEDAVPDMRTALEIILASQTILKMEDAISTQLEAVTAVTGPRPRNFSTAIDLIKDFPNQYKSIVGTWYVFTSINTHLDIYNGLTSAQIALLARGGIELIPIYGLGDDQMVVAHGHGVAGGFNIRSVEEERQGSMQETTILTSASAGIGFDPNFVRRAVLAS